MKRGRRLFFLVYFLLFCFVATFRLVALSAESRAKLFILELALIRSVDTIPRPTVQICNKPAEPNRFRPGSNQSNQQICGSYSFHSWKLHFDRSWCSQSKLTLAFKRIILLPSSDAPHARP
jgi:hypothetical protein